MYGILEKNEILGKTLLLSYEKLCGLIQNVDLRINNTALSSSCFYGEMYDCQYFCDRIEKLMDVKREYLIIKHLADEILFGMEYKYKQAIKFRFVKSQTVQQTAEALGITVRGVYRMIKSGLQIFSDKLRKNKDFDFFCKFIMKEKWMLDIFFKSFKSAKESNAVKPQSSVACTKKSPVGFITLEPAGELLQKV